MSDLILDFKSDQSTYVANPQGFYSYSFGEALQQLLSENKVKAIVPCKPLNDNWGPDYFIGLDYPDKKENKIPCVYQYNPNFATNIGFYTRHCKQFVRELQVSSNLLVPNNNWNCIWDELYMGFMEDTSFPQPYDIGLNFCGMLKTIMENRIAYEEKSYEPLIAIPAPASLEKIAKNPPTNMSIKDLVTPVSSIKATWTETYYNYVSQPYLCCGGESNVVMINYPIVLTKDTKPDDKKYFTYNAGYFYIGTKRLREVFNLTTEWLSCFSFDIYKYSEVENFWSDKLIHYMNNWKKKKDEKKGNK